MPSDLSRIASVLFLNIPESGTKCNYRTRTESEQIIKFRFHPKQGCEVVQRLKDFPAAVSPYVTINFW
jgi:hypothetical protein